MRSTSKAASVETPARVTQAILLLHTFSKAGAKGLIAEEAGIQAGLSHTGYWKRVSDLVERGLITEQKFVKNTKPNLGWFDSDKVPATRTATSGKQAIVWKITPEGRNVLKPFNVTLKAADKVAA